MLEKKLNIAGIGIACFDGPLLAVMALYWNKRKSLANGMSYALKI